MADQPVTLKCGNQRLDPAIYIPGQRDVSQQYESKERRQGADETAFVSSRHNQLDEYGGPGKEYKGFIKIREGSVSDPQMVRVYPADNNRCRMDC